MKEETFKLIKMHFYKMFNERSFIMHSLKLIRSSNNVLTDCKK